MNIGDKAPEILGKDEQGRDIRLSDYTVLLSEGQYQWLYCRGLQPARPL